MIKYSQFLINYFSNVVSDLIPDYCNYFPQKSTHSLSTIIETFQKHPSILNIKKRKLDSMFSFRKTTQEQVSKIIWDLIPSGLQNRLQVAIIGYI